MKYYRKLRNWICQTAAYAVFFWKRDHRDWDYGFTVDLVKFKLTRMANCIESNNTTEANHRVVRQIRYAIYLIDEWQSDRYKDSLIKQFEEKWGDPMYSWEPHTKSTVTLKTKYLKATTKELHDEAVSDMMKILVRVDDYDKKLEARFFRHVAKHFKQWWD